MPIRAGIGLPADRRRGVLSGIGPAVRDHWHGMKARQWTRRQRSPDSASIPAISTATASRHCWRRSRGPDDGAALHAAHAEIRPSVHACACRIADRSAGPRMRAAIAISRAIRRPAGPGRRSRPARCNLGRVLRDTRPPGGCLINFYGADRENGPAPGSRRSGFRCAGGLDFARRFLLVSRRRTQAPRSYPLVPPQVPATCWCSAATRGLPSTASTGSMPAHRRLLPEGGRINLTLRRVTRSRGRNGPPIIARYRGSTQCAIAVFRSIATGAGLAVFCCHRRLCRSRALPIRNSRRLCAIGELSRRQAWS